MKSVMKKAGWTVVSLLPVFMFLLIQIGCSVVAMVVITILETVHMTVSGQGGAEVANIAMQRYLDNVIPILVVSQVIAVLVFGLWYYFAYGKKKRPEGTPKPLPVHYLLIVAVGISAQFFISSILNMIQSFIPQLLEQYNELMEQVGITDGAVLTILSTVILAPLSEELVCRGVGLKLAGKVSTRFWVANVIQALAFGILHVNLVQGIYAFGLGLILGALYGRFQNIWLCMLLHAVMNASSFLVEPVYSLLTPASGEVTPVTFLAVLVLSTVMLALCTIALLKRKTHQI